MAFCAFEMKNLIIYNATSAIKMFIKNVRNVLYAMTIKASEIKSLLQLCSSHCIPQ